MKKGRMSAWQLLVCCGLLAAVTLFLCLLFSLRKKEDGFGEFCQRLFVREMTANTIGLHYSLAHPERFGIKEYPVTLPIYEPGSELRASDGLMALWAEFQALPTESLSEEDQYACDCLKRELLLSIALADFPYYGDPLSPVQGMQGELPILLSEYAFREAKDVEEYLMLLSQTGEYFTSLLQYETEKCEAGLSPSAESLLQAAEECDTIVTLSQLEQGQSLFQTSFQERLDGLSGAASLSPEEKQAFLSRNNAILAGIVLPAFQELKAGLIKLSHTAPKDPVALSSLPRGREYYRLLLASVTGSSKTPEEVRSLLERTLVQETEAIRQLTASYPGCLASLKTGSYEDLGFSDASVILSDLEARMKGIYPDLPEQCSVTVKSVSPGLQSFCAPAFYLTSPLDEVTDNVIYVNPAATPSGLELYVTLAHEGYPGHLYQNAYSAANLLSLSNNRLRQLTGCGGYLEGWALYVEQNAYDDASKLLVSQGRAADAVCVQIAKHERSLRLCLCALFDLMIHYDGAEIKDLTDVLSAFGAKQGADLAPLYAYICAAPCNYMKYYLGYLELLKLKEEARQLWAESYDDLRFHEFFLTWGPADFVSLENKLKEDLADNFRLPGKQLKNDKTDESQPIGRKSKIDKK